MYGAHGALVHRNVAAGSEADVRLPAPGVYIVSAGKNTVKVAFE